MTLYLQNLDSLLVVTDAAKRHRIAIAVSQLAVDMSTRIDDYDDNGGDDDDTRADLCEALARVEDIASMLCAAWYDIDCDDPAVRADCAYDTDRLLRLASQTTIARTDIN